MPDVELVVHWDVPDCLSTYLLQAGMAGRDLTTPSSSILLVNAPILKETNRRTRTAEEPIVYQKQIDPIMRGYIGSSDCRRDFFAKDFPGPRCELC